MTHSFVFTDLDDTLFSSLRKQPNRDKLIVGALDVNKEPMSFLNEKQHCFFQKLKKMGEIIPITARNTEQLNRVILLENYKHAAWKHGALIRLHGKIDQYWQNRSIEILSHYQSDFFKLMNIFKSQKKFYDFDFISKKCTDLKNNAYHFHIKRKIKNGDMIIFDDLMKIINDNVDLTCYYIHRQIDYITLLPKDINKRLAVLYLKEKLNPHLSIGCGDSDVDIDFMKECDYFIFPNTSIAFNELYEQKNNFKNKFGGFNEKSC